jgi:hypothetical protein
VEDKVIVMARIEGEDVSWVSEELQEWVRLHMFPFELTDGCSWQHAIDHMDDMNWILHPPFNKGREAMAYLTFLINYYDNLPELMIFLHAHPEGWP